MTPTGLFAMIAALTIPAAAIAQVATSSRTNPQCNAYYTFDDTLADSGGNGYNGEMIGAAGKPGSARYVEGKYGRALMLDGSAAMRALIDLHYGACPQVTFTAWIRVSPDAKADTSQIFSTGQGSGPGLRLSGRSLTLNGTENGLYQPNATRAGAWTFVGGVYDYSAGTYRLHWGGRSSEAQVLSQYRNEPQDAFWIGTVDDDWNIFVSGVAIDDLRITGKALDTSEVIAMRNVQLPGDHFRPTQLPGDHFDEVQLPGDHFDPTQLPGDHFDETQLPGDHFDQTQLPGDHFDQTQLPGDHFDQTQLPGDHFDNAQLPDDLDGLAEDPTDEVGAMPEDYGD